MEGMQALWGRHCWQKRSQNNFDFSSVSEKTIIFFTKTMQILENSEKYLYVAYLSVLIY